MLFILSYFSSFVHAGSVTFEGSIVESPCNADFSNNNANIQCIHTGLKKEETTLKFSDFYQKGFIVTNSGDQFSVKKLANSKNVYLVSINIF